MNKAWTQFLLVAVPVLSLVGAWLALKGVTKRPPPNKHDETTDE
ncbi:hypothetical protein [Pseudothauera rhizosphaerae]|nr:hypothetical protein [Pseudothauera rhizosphaerae]